jgi:hypothetical protein
VLSLAIPRELFEPVAWRNPQILERLCGIEDSELPLRHALDIRRKPPRALSPEDLLGPPVAEAPNHRIG